MVESTNLFGSCHLELLLSALLFRSEFLCRFKDALFRYVVCAGCACLLVAAFVSACCLPLLLLRVSLNALLQPEERRFRLSAAQRGAGLV